MREMTPEELEVQSKLENMAIRASKESGIQLDKAQKLLQEDLHQRTNGVIARCKKKLKKMGVKEKDIMLARESQLKLLVVDSKGDKGFVVEMRMEGDDNVVIEGIPIDILFKERGGASRELLDS